jgi:hypothetical protein
VLHQVEELQSSIEEAQKILQISRQNESDDSDGFDLDPASETDELENKVGQRPSLSLYADEISFFVSCLMNLLPAMESLLSFSEPNEETSVQPPLIKACSISDQNVINAQDTFKADCVGRPIATVSIDFGTTFSSIAYACNLDPELYEREDLNLAPSRVQAQQRYPYSNCHRRIREIPSVLAYDPKTGQAYFGLEVQTALEQQRIQESDKLELLKLLIARPSLVARETRNHLKRKIRQTRRLDPDTSERAEVSPTIVELISDCIRSLWQNALWNLVGRTYAEGEIKSWDIRLILCVPAVWEARETSIMREAAQLAGIPNPEFISEGDAAAALYFGETQDQIDASSFTLSNSFAV